MRSRSDSIARASPKPLITTSQPSAARASAIPRPMPPVEPVTTATKPSGMAAPPRRGARREALGVAGDHALLVGCEPPGLHAARRSADERGVRGIGLFSEVEPEPGRVAADARPDGRRVLADAAGEDE